MSFQDLPTRMASRADADGLPPEHPLRASAKTLADACADFATPVPRLIGLWARARKTWCAYTGEELL